METREETLERIFAWATECQLATLEDLRERKKFPKYGLERHESIARTMLAVCRNEKIKTRYQYGNIMQRLQEILDKDKKGCGNEIKIRNDDNWLCGHEGHLCKDCKKLQEIEND